jgi:solute carrier family 6 amino acid/orphan transporter-like 15/16/17/18/20
MLAIEGIPIFYLELAIGQRLRKGAIGVWNQVSPYLAGIGISSAVVSFNVALYYNTIIAWCLFYFVQVSITLSTGTIYTSNRLLTLLIDW